MASIRPLMGTPEGYIYYYMDTLVGFLRLK